MFGDERAGAKEICLVFVGHQGQGSTVSETKLEMNVRICSHPISDFCKHRNNWVSSHTSNFSTIGQSVPEIRGWSVHVRTCRGAQPKTCIKHMAAGSLTTHQISEQCAKRFPRYGKVVRTCARAATADAPHP